MPSRPPNKTAPILLQFLLSKQIGESVTWAEIEEVCGKDMKMSGRSTIVKVNKEMEAEHGRKLSLPEARGFVIVSAGTDTTERMRHLSPCYVERLVRPEEGDALQELSSDLDGTE